MTANACFAIFVKTPGLSPVKTRLGAQIGTARAERFHLLSAHAVASVCAQLKPYSVDSFFAVAETNIELCKQTWSVLPLIPQPLGGLGERMAVIYATLRQHYRQVFLIGADVPHITPIQLQNMLDWLNQAEQPGFAIAPSEDGGFWCIGGNADIPLSAWTNVQYSAAETLAEFSKNLSAIGEIKLFDCLCDVDEYADLLKLKCSLDSLDTLCAPQAELFSEITGWLPAKECEP